MIQIHDTSNVLLPKHILKKQMEKGFVAAIKDYLRIRYPEYEFMYVKGDCAVCLTNKKEGARHG